MTPGWQMGGNLACMFVLSCCSSSIISTSVISKQEYNVPSRRRNGRLLYLVNRHDHHKAIDVYKFLSCDGEFPVRETTYNVEIQQ